MRLGRFVLAPSPRKIDAWPMSARPTRQASIVKRDAGLSTSISVPYCAWSRNASKWTREDEPFLQIIKTLDFTMAAVMRVPNATGDISNPTECVARNFQTEVPNDPFFLELPEDFGPSVMDKLNTSVDVEFASQCGFSTAFIAFESYATPAPQVSFSYQADGDIITRNLRDDRGLGLNFWRVDAPQSAKVSQTARLEKRGTAKSVASSRALGDRRDLVGVDIPLPATYTVKILENQYFSGRGYLDFYEIMNPTPSVWTESISTLQASRTPVPVTALPSLLPASTLAAYTPQALIPTSFVQANVVFELKGANQNVALGFANWGAVVGFTAVTAVAALGCLILICKARAAGRVQPAAQASANAGQIETTTV